MNNRVNKKEFKEGFYDILIVNCLYWSFYVEEIKRLMKKNRK